MRAILFAAAGVLAIGAIGSAHAADMGPPMLAKAPPPPPAWFNWTGFYIGGNFGGGWAHQDATLSGTEAGGFTFSGTGTSNASGILGGGQVGFNWQFDPHWVLGVEADGDWANILGSHSGCSTFTTPAVFAGIVAGCSSFNQTLNDFGTVRGRLGYAWNNILLYGTGGWAWGNSSGTSKLTCITTLFGVCTAAGAGGTPFTGGAGSFSNTLSGWSAGAGLEWGFLPNWTARIEYLHLEFDGVATNYPSSATILGIAGTTANHISSNNGIDVVRVGVNYLFNFGGPPMAMR